MTMWSRFRSPAGLITLSIILIIYLQGYVHYLESQQLLNQETTQEQASISPVPYSSPTPYPSLTVSNPVVKCLFNHIEPLYLYKNVCDNVIECEINGRYFLYMSIAECRQKRTAYWDSKNKLLAQYRTEMERLNELRRQISSGSYRRTYPQVPEVDIQGIYDRQNKLTQDAMDRIRAIGDEHSQHLIDAKQDLNQAANDSYESVRNQQKQFNDTLRQESISMCIGIVDNKYKNFQLNDPSRNKGIVEQYKEELSLCYL